MNNNRHAKFVASLLAFTQVTLGVEMGIVKRPKHPGIMAQTTKNVNDPAISVDEFDEFIEDFKNNYLPVDWESFAGVC
jgi:hypothetical protein